MDRWWPGSHLHTSLGEKGLVSPGGPLELHRHCNHWHVPQDMEYCLNWFQWWDYGNILPSPAMFPFLTTE
jgi:hypothetical protein